MLQCVMLVAKQRAVTLQGSTQDGIDACDLMDYVMRITRDRKSVHRIGKCVEYNLTYMLVMDGDG